MSLIIPANTLASGGFSVDNSLRLNGTNDYMHKTGSAGSRREFTISFWMKGGSPGGGTIFSTGDYDAGDGVLQITVSTSGRLTFDDYDQDNDSYNQRWVTPGTKIFRDPAAWYHICVAVDSTQSTYANRVKFYLNGENISSLFTNNASDRPVQNADFHINYAKPHTLGRRYDAANYFPGYISEFCLIDGTTLDPTSFGEFDEDSGIWKPIDVSGLTFGTNGFYLDFEDSGNLGNDANGGTDLTEVNLTAIDQTTDTPTNNFATFNPLSKNDAGTVTFSNGNLTTAHSGTDSRYASYSTIGASTGKWYAEIRIDASSQPDVIIGVGSNIENINRLGTYLGTGSDPTSIGYFSADGEKYINDVSSSYGNSYGNNDIIGVAMDLDNNKLYFSKNGTWQNSGNPESGATGTGALSLTANLTYFIGSAHATTTTRTSTYSANFGNPTFTGTDQSDGNSRGSFEYAPPSGYLSLCTANLSEVLG